MKYIIFVMVSFFIAGCGGSGVDNPADSCNDWEIYDTVLKQCTLQKARCNSGADCSGSDQCDLNNHTCKDPCSITVCGDNQLCSVENKTAVCSCKDGFIEDGDHCVLPGVCYGITCDDHGGCNEVTQKCDCNTGYINGEDQPFSCILNLCFGVSCSNNGHCSMDHNGDPFCSCEDNYTQKDKLTCVVTAGSLCEGVDCGGGSCIVTDNIASCICDEGFELRDDPLSCISMCDGVTCSDLGTCGIVDNKALCSCHDGYFPINNGIECGNPCGGNSCSGHGTCGVIDGSAVCSCETGYTNYQGDCIETCERLTCPGNSYCFKEDVLEYCACDAGFVGVGSECIASNWSSIALGTGHSCGVFGGQLYCWGSNTNGALGQLGLDSSKRPQKVENTHPWEEISSGEQFSCGIRNSKIYCWGQNDQGQLGNGHFGLQSYPDDITVSGGWSAVSSGRTHSCGIRGGVLYCWGTNETLELGGTGEIYQNTPSNEWSTDERLVALELQNKWEKIDAGDHFTCGINSGNLYCWGRCTERQTSGWNDKGYHNIGKVSHYSEWSDISCGGTHSCGIRNEKLYCWGTSTLGALGLGERTVQSYSSRVVDSEKIWSAVSAGTDHTCGISEGKLYCWGDNSVGQLGLGSQTGFNTPQRVGTASNWSTITTGDYYSCGIRQGDLYCWGKNDLFQLGIGETEVQLTPKRLPTIIP